MRLFLPLAVAEVSESVAEDHSAGLWTLGVWTLLLGGLVVGLIFVGLFLKRQGRRRADALGFDTMGLQGLLKRGVISEEEHQAIRHKMAEQMKARLEAEEQQRQAAAERAADPLATAIREYREQEGADSED